MMQKLALAVAVIASIAVPISGALPRAHCIIHKGLTAPETNNYFVQGKPFEVTYTVINTGDDVARNVAITDNFPESDFDVKGNSLMKFAELEAGQNVSTKLVVTPKVSGIMSVSRAEVTYEYSQELDDYDDEEEDGASSEWVEARAFSSTPGKVEIVRSDVYDRVSATHSVQIAAVFAASLLLVVYPWIQMRDASAPSTKTA